MLDKKQSLEQLIKKIKKGNVDAFEQLYKSYNNYVYHIILDYFNKNINDAEDLLQDVFLKVFQNIETLKKIHSFRSWLAGITLNVCRDYMRKKYQLKNKAFFIDLESVDILMDEKDLPEIIIEREEDRKIILECIEHLSSYQRLTLMLFYFDDFSYKEIAEALDSTETSVRMALYKARKNLRREVKRRLGLQEMSGSLGLSLLMTFYGDRLIHQELESQLSKLVWKQINPQIHSMAASPMAINFMAPVSTLVLVALTVLSSVFGASASSLEKPAQMFGQGITFTQVPPSVKRTDGLDFLNSRAVKKEEAEKKGTLVPIVNTAYVNGQATNTVIINEEKESSELLKTEPEVEIGGWLKNGSKPPDEFGSLLLLGVVIWQRIINENYLKKRREKMRLKLKKQMMARVFTPILLVCLMISSVPVSAESLPESTPSAVQETVGNSVSVENPVTAEPEQVAPTEGISTENQGIQPAGFVTVDGISFTVSIAKSLDGSRPGDGSFQDTDSIDLGGVGRFDMLYAYLKIDYSNHSGVDLSSPSITMQMPKAGDPAYYEVMTLANSPVDWIAYPNTPTGDGNSNFPAGNMSTNGSTRLMTWGGSGTISDGTTGTVYIKIPMRDPFTKFGTFDYHPKMNFTKSGTAASIDEGAQFTITGQNDAPSFSLSKEADLGFIPTEPDADNYYYVKYKVATAFSLSYVLPKTAYQFDRNLPILTIDFTMPTGSELVSKPITATQNGNTLRLIGQSNDAVFVLRYPKADYPDPNQTIDIPGVFNGRFSGDALVTQNIIGSENTLTHPIGTGSTIPIANLGSISTGYNNLPISEDALKVGSVPFTSYNIPLRRSGDTQRGDELVYEFNGLEYIKGGSPLPTDYGVTLIYLSNISWTGPLDPSHPMSGSITVYFDDGSSEVIKTLTEAQMVAGGTLYNGNVPSVSGGYQPPSGKVAKRVVFTFENTPQGFTVLPWVNGYLKGYPTEGADSVRFNRNTNLYGPDTGSGRPLATGSGSSSYSVGIVKNSQFQPQFSMDRTSAGTVNPGQTDTLKLQSTFANKGTQSYVNPEFDVLLPSGYTYEGFTNQTTEINTNNMRVFNLPDGRLETPPVIEEIPNYNGTGRMLVRIKFNGILQESEILGGLLTIRAAQYMSPGNYTIDGYFAAENIGAVNNLSNTYTPYSLDTNDMNGNGMVNDYIFGSQSRTLSISRGVGTSLYAQTKGILDPSLTGLGTTKQNSQSQGALTLEYNGATPMNNLQLLTVLPYEGDGNTLYGGVIDGQRVLLSSPVDVSAYPGATVYYNDNPTNDPNATGWTTTYSSNARSIKVVFPPAFELLSGGTEKVTVPLVLQVPGTADATQLTTVQGTAYLPVRAYSNVDTGGLDGASSTLTSLALGTDIHIFNDTNGNGIKETTETWATNVGVDLFNLSDDPATATPVYRGTTDSNGYASFLDGFNGVSLNLQGYRMVVHKPSTVNFVTGVGTVTMDGQGQQGVVFNTSNQLVHMISAFAPQMMSISGHYWQDYEAVPNGILDGHDLLTTAGRTVKLYNVTDGRYESQTATVGADGSYTLDNVVIGPAYRVEMTYDESREVPSVISDNVMTKTGTNLLGYTFDSSSQGEGTTVTVDGAIVENGIIDVRFSTDGTNTIGTKHTVTRSLPTTYTANLGTTEDTTGQTSGTFVVPNGYRLLNGEPLSQQVTIDQTTKQKTIVFLVELLEPNLSGEKTATPSSENLHPGDTLTYSLTARNTGSLEATQVVMTDQLPENTEFVSADPGVRVDDQGQVSYTIGSLEADGGSETIHFTVRIRETVDQGTWSVVNDRAQLNGIPMNATSHEVTQRVLTSIKTGDIGTNQKVKVGDTITYTITTTNTGAAPSEPVIIEDRVPVGTTLVEGSQGTEATVDKGVIGITAESLAPGESLILTFKVTVDDGAKEGSSVDNTASVNGQDTNRVTTMIGSESKKEEPGGTPGILGPGGTGLPQTGGIKGIFLPVMISLMGVGILWIYKKRTKRHNKKP